MDRWKQRVISVVALAAFAGLPMAAATCAAVCERPGLRLVEPSRVAPGASCHDAGVTTRVMAGSDHDCGRHDGGDRLTSATLVDGRSHRLLIAADLYAPGGVSSLGPTHAPLPTAFRAPPGALFRPAIVLRV